MIRPPEKRSGPAVGMAGTESYRMPRAGDTAVILPQSAVEWDDFAHHVNGCFVVLVETSGGKYRRRVWLTLAAAERAAVRAKDNGHNAVVVLAELKPLYRVIGGESR